MEHSQQKFMGIDCAALQRNAQASARAVAVPVIAVVKFDGYGVGIAQAARAWQAAGAAMFAVAESREALALREAGFREDILLMAPVADTQTLQALLQHGVILTVSSLENAKFYAQNRADAPVRVHVKVDTGMGRFGVRWDDSALLDIYKLEGLEIQGIFSHFAKSFEKKYDLTGRQLAKFLLACKAVEDGGFRPGMRHIANSCAALRFPQTHLDAVRLGSCLVGALLCQTPVQLERVAMFHAQVVAVQELEKGDTLGYASVCRAKRRCRAAVVAMGFYDGYGMTGAPDPYPALDFGVYIYHLWQRWRRVPTVQWQQGETIHTLPMLGRVGSQYTLFDATGLDIAPGQWVAGPMNLLQCTARRVYKNQ